jgi:hypothetical protein
MRLTQEGGVKGLNGTKEEICSSSLVITIISDFVEDEDEGEGNSRGVEACISRTGRGESDSVGESGEVGDSKG